MRAQIWACMITTFVLVLTHTTATAAEGDWTACGAVPQTWEIFQSPDNNSNPVAVAIPHGAYIAWEQVSPGLRHSNVLFQRLSSEGEAVGNPVRVDDAVYANKPRLVNVDDHILVIWVQGNEEPFQSVAARAFDFEGRPLGDTQIVATTFNAPTNVVSAVWTGAEILVMWTSEIVEDQPDIAFVRLDAMGEQLDEAVLLGPKVASNNIAAAWDESGLRVAWQSFTHIFVARFDRFGSQIQSPVAMVGNGQEGEFVRLLSLQMEQNRFHLIWAITQNNTAPRGGALSGLYIARLAWNEMGLERPVSLLEPQDVGIGNAALGRGLVLAIWDVMKSRSDRYSVNASARTTDGHTVMEQTPIFESQQYQQINASSVATEDGFITFWREFAPGNGDRILTRQIRCR